MCNDSAKPYPGSLASENELICLAGWYQNAATTLFSRSLPKDPLAHAPSRLCAIHAIELYLNVFLIRCGEPPDRIRSRQHNLAERFEAARAHGLSLKKKTIEHLSRMTDDREYLVMRYGPELAAEVPPVNRLLATLNDVAAKVTGRPAAAA